MHRIIKDNLPQIRELCKKHNVEKLFLFGSALEESYSTEQSDIDFLVEFEKMEPIEHKNSYFGLLTDLKSLLDSVIDITELCAINNPYFLEEVLETRRLIYNAEEHTKISV